MIHCKCDLKHKQAVAGYDRLQKDEACIIYASTRRPEMIVYLVKHGVRFDKRSLQRAIMNCMHYNHF